MRIVRDQQYRAFEVGQRFHQSFTRVDVQVVRRLIENEQLRRVARRQRQQQAGLLAAR